jgi:GAF domain-containing protein
MNRLFTQLFTIQFPYADPQLRQRARAIIRLIWLQLAALVALTLLDLAFPVLPGERPSNTVLRLGLVLATLGSLFILWLVQSGRCQVASWLLIALIGISNFGQIIEAGTTQVIPLNGANALLLVLTLVAAATLTGPRAFGLIFVGAVGALVWLGFRQAAVATFAPVAPARIAPQTLAELLVGMIAIGLVMFLYIRGTGRVLTEGVNEAERWQHIARVQHKLAEADTEPATVRSLLMLIREELGYNAGAFYVVNRDGAFTRLLRLSLGNLDVVEGEALYVSPGSALAEAAQKRQITQTDINDLAGRRGHLLPASRVSLALPILDKGDLLGVLDVQHNRDLEPSDSQTLHEVALALGAALARVRLVNDLRQSVREQETSAQQLRAQLSELRQREGMGLSNVWSRYLSGRGQQAIGFDLEGQGMSLTPANDLPPALADALGQGKMHIQATPAGQVINVPIRFREQTLGAMSFTLPPGQQPGQRQLEMATAVAERLAVALENTRLLEQTQAQAQRERTASTVGARMLGQTDVRRLLDEAAASFTEALNAVHTRIYLQPGVLAESATSHHSMEVPAS